MKQLRALAVATRVIPRVLAIATHVIPRVLAIAVLHLFFAGTLHAQLDNVPPNNDTAILLQSKALNQPRSIWVHVPPTYATTDQSYPVLYLLDGDSHFKYTSELVDFLSSYDVNRIPELIVVGIVNIDRGKDMGLANPPSTTEGARKFLEYIREELIPYMDGHYRTAPYRILMGHSLAGQFALYARDNYPALFNANILVSPAIQDFNDPLITRLGAWLQDQHPAGKMFISLGGENPRKVDLLVQQLRQHAGPSFQWDYRQYPADNHFSVPYVTMFDALKFIYKDWFLDFRDTARYSYRDIEARFDRLSKEFGYSIHPDEDFINSCGYTQLGLHNIDGAIDFFQHNVKDHPNSYNVYDSMGEAYMDKGEKELAIRNYERSIQLNPNNENGKQMLKKLQGGQ